MDIELGRLAKLFHDIWAAEDGLKNGNMNKVKNHLANLHRDVPRVNFLLNVTSTWSATQGAMPINIAAMLGDGVTVDRTYQGNVAVTCDDISTGPVPLTLYDSTGKVVPAAMSFVNGRWYGKLLLQPNTVGIYPPVERIRLRDLVVDLAGETHIQWVG